MFQITYVGKSLEVGLVLDQLLSTTVQKTNMRITSQNLLTLQLENQTQDSVSSRMLRSKVDGEVARVDVDAVIDLDILGDGRSERGGRSDHISVDVVVVRGSGLSRHEFGEC